MGDNVANFVATFLTFVFSTFIIFVVNFFRGQVSVKVAIMELRLHTV